MLFVGNVDVFARLDGLSNVGGICFGRIGGVEGFWGGLGSILLILVLVLG